MNSTEGPEWETASSLLADLRAVMHNQTLSVETLVDKFNSFDFFLLQNAHVVIRRAAVLHVMVLLKLILTRQEQRSKNEQHTSESNGDHIVNLAQKKLFQLRSVRCQPIVGPIFVDEDQTFVLHATNTFVKTLSKSQIKRFVSDRQYFSYLLQRTDGSTIQLGLDKDRCEVILQNPSLVQTIPDPLAIQIFTTVSTFGDCHHVCPIQFVGINPIFTSKFDEQDLQGSCTDRPAKRPHTGREIEPLDSTPGRKPRRLEHAPSFESVENLQSPVAKVYCQTKGATFTSLQEQVDVENMYEARKSVNISTKDSWNKLDTPGPRKSQNYLIRPVKVPTTVTSPTQLSKSPADVGRSKSPYDQGKVINTSFGLIIRAKSRSQLQNSVRKSQVGLSPSLGPARSKDAVHSPAPAKSQEVQIRKASEKTKLALRKLEDLPTRDKSNSLARKSQAMLTPPTNQTNKSRSSLLHSPQPSAQPSKEADGNLPWTLKTVPTNKGFFVVRSHPKKDDREWLNTPKPRKSILGVALP